ncbi:MAG: hypothetical protein HKL96_12490 [Phycisphaerales bacterium]|nr:hypothetical protein [Phycisphaerales bacterium]
MSVDRRRFVQLATVALGAGMLPLKRVEAGPQAARVCRVLRASSEAEFEVVLAGPTGAAALLVDEHDAAVVPIVADMLAADLYRITGQRSTVISKPVQLKTAVIIGTLGASRWIKQIVDAGKLDVAAISGQWEAAIWQTVHNPLPGIDRALVIVGSDRRGTAYGVMDLSEAAGVSPWHWWADVPVKRADAVGVTPGRRECGSPFVKYRGIFINDEDWSFEPWAAKTVDPKLGNIGPKTYQKVFELMLRLKFNYLWPAMHTISTPFAAIAENAALADRYAIVMGSSHVEPMLANAASFLGADNSEKNGPWNFVTNSKRILAFWRASVQTRGKYEAIWTIGMRGPWDDPLWGVHTLGQERSLVQKIIGIQRAMLRRYVRRYGGKIPQCYVPYKEALLVYNSGLEVPPDVTIIWPDDNFGYVRQLSDATERKRPGGSGVYYHLEYLGGPRPYCWLNTTPPALVWEEMKKAWDNDARTIWIFNVGGIKPRELGVTFAARLAWNPTHYHADAQDVFIRSFAADVCGQEHAQAISDLMRDYYMLGQVRRPEAMSRQWTASLNDYEIASLAARYHALLAAERSISSKISRECFDAYFEIFGYSAQMLAATGLIFLHDRLATTAAEAKNLQQRTENEQAVTHWRGYIERQVAWYNNELAGGKWRYYQNMGGASPQAKWVNVQWPWVHQRVPKHLNTPEHKKVLQQPAPQPVLAIGANAFVRKVAARHAAWIRVSGLGWSGGAMALWPAIPENRWDPATGLGSAPRMDYTLTLPRECRSATLVLKVLPTYELHPGMKLRIALSFNHGPMQVMTVPFASSEARINSHAIRRLGALDDHIPLQFAVGDLAAGKHSLTVYAVDPGIVLDQIQVVGG